MAGQFDRLTALSSAEGLPSDGPCYVAAGQARSLKKESFPLPISHRLLFGRFHWIAEGPVNLTAEDGPFYGPG